MRAPMSPLTRSIAVSFAVLACSTSASQSPVPPAQSTALLATPSTSAPVEPTGAPSFLSTSDPPPVGAPTLPINGAAGSFTTRIAAGSSGTLFALITGEDRATLFLLDRDGDPSPGWPILLPDVESCRQLLPADDGSVRAICQPSDQDAEGVPSVAFAFDPLGRTMAGWPVGLPPWCCDAGRVIDDTLIVLTQQPHEDSAVDDVRIASLSADGAVIEGVKVPIERCCEARWSIGPDGVAYGALNAYGSSAEAPTAAKLVAIGQDGLQRGFPITIGGRASEPSFFGDQLYVSSNQGPDRQARILAFDAAGALAGSSAPIGFPASDACEGVEGSCEIPVAPLVGSNGATFVVGGMYPATIVAGIGPSMTEMIPGWPFRTDAWRQPFGGCVVHDCDGHEVAAPAIGPGDVIYLPLTTDPFEAGGIIVAIGPDGRERAGWPVELTRPGAGFWSVVVGMDGTVHALAVEPEAGDGHSATVLAFAPDSTVRYATTILEP